MSATPTANELKALAQLRLQEAKSLMASGFLAGAGYLAGYAVELALKAVVCRTLGVAGYPDKVFKGSLKSHNLADLVLLSGLSAELDARSQDAAFLQFWDIVTSWDVQDRYRLSFTEQQVADLIQALEDPSHGIFAWFSDRW